jgi:hypothetical protein
MPMFTLPLKEVIRIEKADVETGVGIGLDIYPIFDPTYRAPLNRKIVDHYWNQEIGQETIGMWRFAMRRKMNEIMRYYNQVLKTELITIDPLSTVNVKNESNSTHQHDASSTGTSDNTSENDGSGRSVSSEFPQTALSGNGDYATSAVDNANKTQVKANVENAGSETGTDTDSNSSTSTGYTGAASQLLTAYRSTLLNVDIAIIDDMSELFMGLWGPMGTPNGGLL